MKNLIIFSFMLMVFTSCMTTNRIKRHCDDFAALCITETVKETEYRDTTIYVDKPVLVLIPQYKDSVRIRDSVKIVPVFDSTTNSTKHYAEMRSIHQEFGIIGVDAWVHKSEIGIDAYLTDSTILFNYQDSIKLENAIKDESTTNTITLPPEKYVPKSYRFAFWIVVLELVALAAWLIVKYKLLLLLKNLKILKK